MIPAKCPSPTVRVATGRRASAAVKTWGCAGAPPCGRLVESGRERAPWYRFPGASGFPYIGTSRFSEGHEKTLDHARWEPGRHEPDMLPAVSDESKTAPRPRASAHTAREIAAAVRAGSTDPLELAEVSLTTTADVQARLNAFITITHDVARKAARAAAAEPPGPLAGVPVVIKDNLCLEGAPTTAGSRLLETFVPPYSATVVERLLEAGAVPVAKG